MSLDFLRDNTDIINKGAVKAKAPINFTDWNCQGFKSDLSALTQAKKSGVAIKANKVVKLYANNEKEIVDLCTRTLIAKPELTRDIARGLRRGLSAMQREIKAQGYIVDMVKAYNMSKKRNNLLGSLFAFIAKGLLVVDDRQSKAVKAHNRGTASIKIRLVSKRATETANYRPVGRFSGIKANQATITKFRISAINELGGMLGIDAHNPFKVLADRYDTADYLGDNDLNTGTSYGIDSLTDDEIADCIECGAYSKAEVKAQLDPVRIKKVSRILQKRVAL